MKPLLLDGVVVVISDAGKGGHEYKIYGCPEAKELFAAHPGLNGLLVLLNVPPDHLASVFARVYEMHLIERGMSASVAASLVKQIHPRETRAMWQ